MSAISLPEKVDPYFYFLRDKPEKLAVFAEVRDLKKWEALDGVEARGVLKKDEEAGTWTVTAIVASKEFLRISQLDFVKMEIAKPIGPPMG